MNRGKLSRCFWLGLVASLALLPHPLLACAACYGRSDSRLAEGMNWGILSLLAMVTTVLIGFAAFFIYHLRRVARIAREAAPSEVLGPTP